MHRRDVIVRVATGEKHNMRLRHNMVWMLLGNSSFAAFQWAYLLTLARIAGPESAGKYALSLAFIYPIFALFNLQLMRLQITDRKQQISFSSYAGYAFASSVAAVVCSFLVFDLSHNDASRMAPIFLALASAKAIETLSEVCYGALQHDERMRPVAISKGLRGSSAFIAYFVMLLSGQPLENCLVMIPFSWAAVLLLHDLPAVSWKQRFKLGSALRRAPFVAIIATGAPLGALFFFNQLYMILPRLSLEWVDGLVALGYFAPLASLITLGTLCTGAANGAALPRLSRFHADGDGSGFRRLALKLLAFALVIGGFAMALSLAFSDVIVSAIFGAQNSDVEYTLIWVMTAGIFWYLSTAAGTILTARRAFKVQMIIAAVVALTALLASLHLVPHFGATGAAQALLLGALVKFTFQVSMISRP